jgi:hypothetical protein
VRSPIVYSQQYTLPISFIENLFTGNDSHVVKVRRSGSFEQSQSNGPAGVGPCHVEGCADGDVVKVRVGKPEGLGDAARCSEEDCWELHDVLLRR